MLFTPRTFYRGLTPRGPAERSRIFARVHFAISTFLFGFTALLQFQWLWGRDLAASLTMRRPGFPADYRDAYLSIYLIGLPLFWFATWVFLRATTHLAARLSAWESAYRGLRLPLPVVTRSLHYHAAHYLPVALVTFLTVAGYQLLLQLGYLSELTAPKYLYFLCAEVILAAAYLFKTYWTGMRNLMYANA